MSIPFRSPHVRSQTLARWETRKGITITSTKGDNYISVTGSDGGVVSYPWEKAITLGEKTYRNTRLSDDAREVGQSLASAGFYTFPS